MYVCLQIDQLYTVHYLRIWGTNFQEVKPVSSVHAFSQGRNKRFDIEGLALRDDVFQEPVQHDVGEDNSDDDNGENRSYFEKCKM